MRKDKYVIFSLEVDEESDPEINSIENLINQSREINHKLITKDDHTLKTSQTKEEIDYLSYGDEQSWENYKNWIDSYLLKSYKQSVMKVKNGKPSEIMVFDYIELKEKEKINKIVHTIQISYFYDFHDEEDNDSTTGGMTEGYDYYYFINYTRDEVEMVVQKLATHWKLIRHDEDV